MFYADDRYSLLIVLQARDAAGKDGVIRHVMSGINHQGCRVHSFKTPTTNELEHDYFWRHGMLFRQIKRFLHVWQWVILFLIYSNRLIYTTLLQNLSN